MKLHLFLLLLAVLLLSNLGLTVKEYFDPLQDIRDIGDDIGRGIGDVAGDLGHGLGDVAGDVGDAIGDVGGALGKGVKDLGDDVKGVLDPTSTAAGGTLGALASGEYGNNGFNVIEEEMPADVTRHPRNRFILRSRIIPPVCPKCPDAAVCPRQQPCPPCPPCARCPEPAFTCEMVPNYNSQNDMYMPRPVLADFSQFGM